MTTAQSLYDFIRPSSRALVAPATLLIVYSMLHLPIADGLFASKLIPAIWAYLVVIWWRSIQNLTKNVFDEPLSSRLFLGGGYVTVAIGWTVVLIFLNNPIVAQRLFTIGPIVFGLVWLACRNMTEVQTSQGLWKWSKLPSPRFRSFAAALHGTGLILRGIINEAFIAMDNEIAWILSLTALPILALWCADIAIVRGLVARRATNKRPNT